MKFKNPPKLPQMCMQHKIILLFLKEIIYVKKPIKLEQLFP